MVDHLLAKGYNRSEIYGTTWGDGELTSVGLVDMKCSYVKQIRYGMFPCSVLLIFIKQKSEVFC